MWSESSEEAREVMLDAVNYSTKANVMLKMILCKIIINVNNVCNVPNYYIISFCPG